MSITTVKLQTQTKSALDAFKDEGESYDEVVRKLISLLKEKGLRNELVQAYQSMNKMDVEFLHEWEPASAELHD
ncbi:hypothetical protein HY490_04685 [Candidatus Woesearchaeota archaeon]|nr:hypothetical protein [Candidatus Woesearchaeota archaeon]